MDERDLDLIVQGGTVIDPASGTHGRLDVGVRMGHIAAVEADLSSRVVSTPDADHPGTIVIDATGGFVVPGLIDIHTHVYSGVCPLTVPADESSSRSGVTTVASAGDAGAHTIEGFQSLIVGHSRTRVLAYLHISTIGLAGYPRPESADLGHLDVPAAIRAVGRFGNLIVGIKVREGGLDVIGGNGLEPLRRAIRVAEATELPVMVHITDSPSPFAELAALLRPGDIVTHCFNGSTNGIVKRGELLDAAREARDRGVLFDLGHGAGSFSFAVAEGAAKAGFWPDSISTDLHSLSAPTLARDMPTTMTKLLELGMPLDAVIAAATTHPATALRRSSTMGSLEVGRIADVAVLDQKAGPVALLDTSGRERQASSVLVVRATIRAGVPWGPPWIHPGIGTAPMADQ
jgi:dihydroorotase